MPHRCNRVAGSISLLVTDTGQVNSVACKYIVGLMQLHTIHAAMLRSCGAV